jgi:superfamily I DNA/RNA helicase
MSEGIMLNSRPVSMSLTDQQREIAEASIDARQLVLGGAGTGKTHVLVERIRHLVTVEDVAPGSEILVLSFTRAVVRELRARMRLQEGHLRLVRPATFDSFATRFLRELADSEISSVWRDADYDGRIAAATSALATSDEADAILGLYRHVFVDEIQDLVGVRADLVLELLRHVGGFTVLGDPAQAIYEYQVQHEPRATTSDQFLSTLMSEHEDLSVVFLQQDFRTSHDHGKLLSEIGSILRDPRRDSNAARDPLVEVLASLDHVSSFEDLAVALRGTRDQTAVLCRTNAECLRVSQLLFEQGVEHRLQQEATERVLPAWLAELFRGVERNRWSEARLESLIATRRAEGIELPETNVLIRFLSDAVGDDTVDLEVFRERALRGVLPDHLHDVEDVPVVVSTVHRAKGLEFDRVFFGAPRNGVPEDEVDELRILYVALSRSRDDVWSFKAPNMARWHKAERLDERWVKSNWNERWKTLGWEVRPADVDTMRPPGGGIAKADVAAVQQRIALGLRRGSAVELRLVHVRKSEEPIPFYSVLVDDEVFGETSEHFGEMLRRRLRGRGDVRFPRLLTNIFVSGVQTVVGSPVEGEAQGLGVSGMWLRPRIAGLSFVDWYAE